MSGSLVDSPLRAGEAGDFDSPSGHQAFNNSDREEAILVAKATKVMSAKCKSLGATKCELCHEPGTLENPLTAHHADGNRFNSADSNFLCCHRWLCHTWADWLTQWFMSHKLECTSDDIKWAYKLVTTSNWLLTLTRNRRRQ